MSKTIFLLMTRSFLEIRTWNFCEKIMANLCMTNLNFIIKIRSRPKLWCVYFGSPCMFVFIYNVCINIYMFVLIYICLYLYMFGYVFASMFVCKHDCMWAHNWLWNRLQRNTLSPMHSTSVDSSYSSQWPHNIPFTELSPVH